MTVTSIGNSEKIGVITLFGRFNYGNRLQNYAAMQIWQELGFKPETLVLAERPNVARTLKRTLKHVLGRPMELPPEKNMSKERLEAFDRFNKKISVRKLSTIEGNIADQYYLFSVGSDQVWNPDYMAYNEDWYFLDFARPEQRVTLAPSIGVDELNRRDARCIAKGVRGFEYLSIREKRGAELIKECSGRDAEVVCDPTLVLDADVWRSVSDRHLTPHDPYVFTYLLGGISEDAGYVLDKVTDGGRIPVISLTDREKPGEPPAGPAEFIDLIDNAQHVITDSFHAAVFSCLMETPLTIVRRSGDGAGMFSRLETLSNTLGIEKKVFGGKDFELSNAGDYEGVYDRIAAERSHFMRYLESSLSSR